MTSPLSLLYDIQRGDVLSWDQCRQIDIELSTIDPAAIPSEQIDNVLSYLDRQFLHQQVDQSVSVQLERLVNALNASA